MKYTKLIEEIRTIRDFRQDTVDRALIEEILDAGKNATGIGEGRNISILFIDNGRQLVEKLSGKAGYYGKIIEAPHYLVITTKEFPGFLENSGYIMELMRLKAWDLGLGTCWLSIEDEKELKETLGIESPTRLTAFAAIGHQYKGIFKKDISPRSDRYGIEEIVYLKEWGNPCPIDVLDARGITNVFHYTKFAPSWGNMQPWRFILNDDKVILTIAKNEKGDVYLDGGIIMLYFEKAAQEEGIKGSWNTSEIMDDSLGIPEEYSVIGFFQI